VRLRVLASGSGGNSLAVRSAGGDLLIVDCGLTYRRLAARATACGVDFSSAAGVLFTHDHSDHYAALATFAKRHPGVPLYANADTADAIAARTGVEEGWCAFETAVPFPVAGFTVTPFSTSHDAADPVGFLISDGVSTLFLGTDTGVVTSGFRDAFARADCAVLEFNHDPVLLETSDRPLSLKRRISGRSGHLANEDAAELVRTACPARLKHLLLAHLSEACNTPSLALAAASRALAAAGRRDITPVALSQNTPDEPREF